ncbi:MAG TPA: aminotransferase class IV [Candidatus Eisenbacteria bacterium]|nr:aminotransferase class IV [Candidatus Eisenbacteria bacterium]
MAEDDFALPVDDRGLAYGDGLFETILVVKGQPIWLMAHMDRFRRSARALGYKGVDTLMRRGALGTRELLQAARPARGALRITWTRGSGLGGFAPPDNARPRIVVRLAPVAPRKLTGVRAITLPDLHGGTMAQHKSCSALAYVEAARRARAKGVEEALLSDGQGGIAEASAANLFAVVDRKLITPPVQLPLLPGVTRAWVIRRGRVTRHPLKEKDLARASEAFLTNSISGVVPLLAVNGEKIGSGRPGPVTRQLAAAFAKATSK